MDIRNGTALGPYEIVSPIGAGGMGEVYRARDTRLDRHVAIKVLPQRLASSPDLRARFDREARAISALSHPHICSLFDVGHDNGTHYLVMELLEGETLAERLSRGPLPLEQVLRYGVEIASALDRAHRDGITHRDLKPANIMLTKSGSKLLDFGLAKPGAPERGDSVLTGATEQKALTAEGTMLGTFQYMAPEQIEGREADPRSDIFAFGAVLYEMLTGRRAFDGRSRASIVAAVMSQEPPAISSIQPLVPPALDRVIRNCLAKDPDDRWQTAHDVMLQLRWIAEGGSQVGAPSAVLSRRRIRERAAWTTAALLAIALIATGVLLYRAFRREAPAFRASLPSVTAQYTVTGSRVVSPDGRFVLFSAREPGAADSRIWRQELASAKAVPIDGTEGGMPLVVSPNGRSFLMHRALKLWRVDLAGGTPALLHELPDQWGITWIDDATIAFTHERAIWRMPAAGGKAEKLVGPAGDELLLFPEAMPGRDALLYVRSLPADRRFELRAFDLGSGESRVIGETWSHTLYSDRHLLAVRDGAVVATPFDGGKLAITGEPKVLADGAYMFKPRGDHSLSVSSNGLLLYDEPAYGRSLRWFDRGGKPLGEVAPAAAYGMSAAPISPDSRHVALGVRDPKTGIPSVWLYGLARPTRERLGFTDRYEATGVWSPDRRWIYYASSQLGVPDIYRRPTDGSGVEELIHAAAGLQTPTDISPDGRWLLFTSSHTGTTGSDVMLLSLDDRKVRPLLASPSNEGEATFSRDAKWIAYASNESGSSEVYVRPFPGPGERVQVSTGGGRVPRFSRDGRELFFVRDRDILAVDLSKGFDQVAPVRLFTADEPLASFSPAQDGRLMLLTAPESASARPTHLITNWPALVR